MMLIIIMLHVLMLSLSKPVLGVTADNTTEFGRFRLSFLSVLRTTDVANACEDCISNFTLCLNFGSNECVLGKTSFTINGLRSLKNKTVFVTPPSGVATLPPWLKASLTASSKSSNSVLFSTNLVIEHLRPSAFQYSNLTFNFSGASYVLSVKYRYMCKKDFYGQACNLFCRPNSRIARCSFENGTLHEHCQPGWRNSNGRRGCDEAVCPSNCSGHGKCRSPGNCRCYDGWKGPACDQCQALLGCQHGSCQNPFECNCDIGYTGIFCDTSSRLCEKNANMNLCHNRGICRDIPGSFECDCFPGFTGTYCEQSERSCGSQGPCLNGGTCLHDTRQALQPFCKCTPGYTGVRCENPPTSTKTSTKIPTTTMTSTFTTRLSSRHRSTRTISVVDKTSTTAINPCLAEPCKSGDTCIVNSRNGNYLCISASTMESTSSSTSSAGTLTNFHLLLIVSLSVGVPILCIFIVIVVLLCFRRPLYLIKSSSPASAANSANSFVEVPTNRPSTASSSPCCHGDWSQCDHNKRAAIDNRLNQISNQKLPSPPSPQPSSAASFSSPSTRSSTPIETPYDKNLRLTYRNNLLHSTAHHKSFEQVELPSSKAKISAIRQSHFEIPV